MPDYYPHPSRPCKRRRPLAMLADWAVAALSLAVALMLAAAYLAPLVDPNRVWVFSFFGLGAPLLYVAMCCLFLYWVIRWRWKTALLAAAVLLAGAGYLPRLYRIVMSREYAAQAPQRGEVKVMSYNVRNFTYPRGDRFGESSALQIGALVDSIAPDIICMQEWQSTALAPIEAFESQLRSKEYSRLVELRLPHSDGLHGVGNAIYTRYPMVGHGRIDNRHPLDSTPVVAMWADLLIGADTVRVVNNHLRTTSITDADQDYIMRGEFFDDETERDTKLRGIAARFRDNVRIRAMQADTIARLIAASPYPVIVCGDFNDVPMSYVYQRIKGPLKDTYVEKGRGGAYTYRGFFNLFRIDFIFADPRFAPLGYERLERPYSDHNPVVARLQPATDERK